MTKSTAFYEVSWHAALQQSLLGWVETELRDLPWRQTRDPWSILVSEIMLQQTQVSRVIDRYHDFLLRFPTATSCADAPVSAVIELWAGLGFNRRAVNLWRSAGVIAEEHEGVLPQTLDGLLALPGVGPYTARAILVFAFERDVGVLDTNVGRLLARWTGRSLKASEAQHLGDALVPEGRGWLWNQALFDFATAVCTKRAPACEQCPLTSTCSWKGQGADPALRSAAVSGGQSVFEGSERQVRGRIIDALRGGPVPLSSLGDFGRHGDNEADLDRIVDGLVGDGLVVVTGQSLVLPGR